MSRIITLMSDLGIKDYGVSVWKASLISNVPNCQIIDISHQIDAYNVLEAHYIFLNSYQEFPQGTIHLIGIDAVYKKDARILIVKKDESYFLSIDNGLFSLLFSDGTYEFMKVHSLEKHDSFILKNSFTHLVKKIIEDNDYIKNLPEVDSIKELKLPQVLYREANQTLIGNVIYIDNFGNAITNIKREDIQEYFGNKRIRINANFRFITKVYEYYEEIVENVEDKSLRNGEIMALYNENDYLEIAIYKSNPKTTGGAESLLGLKTGIQIKINLD
ncbi:MAG: SAM-dependent chlorinase/fluorinase [Flavobacteriales bacterium]|nr:SAM-dependent chlorinase/fluorinase [Flavobacteriales bacterium]